jgi:hypothetical protein
VATGPHSPSIPSVFFAALQALQSDVQDVAQHTLSTQKPLEHSVVAAHGAPLFFFPLQMPASQ